MPWTWMRTDAELRAAAQQSDYQPVLDKVRNRVRYWMENFNDSHTIRPGWGHDYVCPTCASHIDFDSAKPGVYHCPSCDKDIPKTQKLSEAWTYYRRFEIGQAIHEAGILYRIEQDKAYADFIRRVVDFYANEYVNFPETPTWMTRGKIMAQSLDEAVWGINVLKGLILIDIDPDSEQAKRWHHLLFLPAARLVLGQQWGIHNIPLWHAAYAVGVAAVFKDDILARQAFAYDLAARNQVLKGFTEDGIWYENSTGYHYYSLEAATNLCRFIRWSGRESEATEVFQRVLDAYVAFLKLGFRDGTMPPFNDGWRHGGLEGLAGKLDTYLGAYRLFEGVQGIEGVSRIADAVSGLSEVGRLGGLLYGKPQSSGAPEPYGSVNLPSNCLAVLRSEGIEVFVKYGNITQSHAHPDALAIAIPGFSEDLGTPGYGSPFHRNWFTKTLSHSTFVVDGKNQYSLAKGVSELTPDNTLSIKLDNAYDGVSASRLLHVSGSQLDDLMEIECEGDHTIDWVFHGAGEFASDGETAPDTLPETEDGYVYLTNVKRYTGDIKAFTARWTLKGKTLSLAFDKLADGSVVYLAQSPDNPADLHRHTILVRTKGSKAVVKARFIVE